MNESAFNELAGWVTEAGLIGRTESELMAGFCRRIAAAGVQLTRSIVILDTLHPIYEGRAFRWRADTPEAVEILDYGRTNVGEAAESWRHSPFFHVLQSGETEMRRHLAAGDPADFPAIAQARDEGATDYLVLVHRFAAEAVIGEMDCVYSSWSSDAPDGFGEEAVVALKPLAPFLKLALKSAALARIAGTLAQTYLGRDPGRRVMSGRSGPVVDGGSLAAGSCAASPRKSARCCCTAICAAIPKFPIIHRPNRPSRCSTTT